MKISTTVTKPTSKWHWLLPPPPEDVARQAEINGGNQIHAAHQVLEEFDRKLSSVRAVNPGLADQLDAMLSGLEDRVNGRFAGISTAFKNIEVIEAEIVSEANVKEAIRAARARLEHAQTTLADESAAKLDAVDLLRLQQIKDQTPVQLDELALTLAAHQEKISALCKGGFDETKIRERIVDGCKYEGRILDTGIWNLRDHIRPVCGK